MDVSSRLAGRGIHQLVVREPVGPVAAFTPWNFPINQTVRKIAPALAAGCSIIVKGPEETPASPAALIQCFADAGVPAGVVNLVYGDPGNISSYLVPHPVIRKISFTGSVPVGKHLAALAGQHMKRATMELGGHSPAVVFDDADLDAATRGLAFAKFRNGGQVCVSPTRFIVQENIFDEFTQRFTAAARAVKVGNGLDQGTQMGPLVNSKRLNAIEDLVGDAVAKGAKIETGGRRIGNEGNFYEPTVLSGLNLDMRVMNEEPFGPLALMIPFRDLEDALTELNRLPYGLAAYAWTRSVANTTALGAGLESWHGDDQSPGSRTSGNAVRRRQGFGLRLGRRHRGDGRLSRLQIRVASRPLRQCSGEGFGEAGLTLKSSRTSRPVACRRPTVARISRPL